MLRGRIKVQDSVALTTPAVRMPEFAHASNYLDVAAIGDAAECGDDVGAEDDRERSAVVPRRRRDRSIKCTRVLYRR